MDLIDMFKKLRDSSDEMIKALENEDEEATEAALGKFVMLIMKFDALK